MSTPGIPVESDFRTRAKANDVPVVRLIGLEETVMPSEVHRLIVLIEVIIW